MASVWPEDLAEKSYRITGTDIPFSSNTIEFDWKATEMLDQIRMMPRGKVEMRHDLLKMEPQDIPAGDRLFLSTSTDRWSRSFILSLQHSPNGGWRPHSPTMGYGLWLHNCYRGFKQTYVYHKGNHKTNWIMNIYHVIDKNYIMTDDIILCHVFQSDGNYNPSPNRVPSSFDFDQLALKSRAEELEALINNPKAFKDFYECDENYGAHPTGIAKGCNINKSTAWQNFKQIKVIGPDGVLVLTLAICNHCSMAYKTGGLKRKYKGSAELVFSNYGTKTLTEHQRRCSGQHHIAMS